ncbi:MAG: Ig-like domain-containing protein [Gemmatimonadota bacterium]
MRRGTQFVALLTLACGGGATQSNPAVDHITVTPSAVSLEAGTTRQLQATAFDGANATISGVSFGFLSSAPSIASVSATGVITALLPGLATITTSAGGRSAFTAVTVQSGPVNSVILTVSRVTLKESDTLRVQAEVRDLDDKLVTRDLTWTSSDPSVAVVTPTGLVLGLAPGGPLTISATTGGKTGTITLSVIPANVASVTVKPDTAILIPGSTKQMTLTAINEFGDAVLNRPVTWSSFNPDAATVDGTGKVTAVGVGESTIIATVGGVSGQALVRVTTLDQARFRIEVTNNLAYPVEVLQNGVVVGTAGGGGSATIERPLTPTLTLSWRMPAPNGRGETLTESYAPILDPTGAIPLVIRNVMADGRVYFNPVLRNLSSQKVLADFPLRENAVKCNCSITTEGTPQEYGYWRWSAGALLKVFRVTDPQQVGPSLSFPVPLGEIEASTGAWRFTLLTAP